MFFFYTIDVMKDEWFTIHSWYQMMGYRVCCIWHNQRNVISSSAMNLFIYYLFIFQGDILLTNDINHTKRPQISASIASFEQHL